jgi:hydroxymethylbilane synthase
VNDVLVGPFHTLDELPPGARIGTGSLRRRAQLLHARPDLQLLEIRGNVDTRLRKLDTGEYDAIVLAQAGLSRLGLAERISYVIPPQVMLPAVGQGALGLETRADDEATQQWLQPLNDETTYQAITAERTLLQALRAGCLAPVGAWARRYEGLLKLQAVVLHPDGTERLAVEQSAPGSEAAKLGNLVAESLLQQGAAALISAARSGA